MKILISLIALIGIISCFNSYASTEFTYEKVNENTGKLISTTTQSPSVSTDNMRLETLEARISAEKDNLAKMITDAQERIKVLEAHLTEFKKLGIVETEVIVPPAK